MKELRFRIIVIALFAALCIYLLYPTFQDYLNNKEINTKLGKITKQIKSSNPTITSTDLKKLVAVEEDSLKNSDPSIKSARDKRVKLGLDLQGGYVFSNGSKHSKIT